MKRSIFPFFLFFFVIFIFMTAPASAQRTPLIGVFDSHAFMQESKVVQEQRRAFLMVLEEKRGQLRAKQVEVQKLEHELRTEGAHLSPEDRRIKSDELSREAKEFQRLREDLAEETRKKNEEITRQILGELNTLLQDFRKKNKYTLILERRVVAAFDEAVDITAAIIKAYDTKKR